ncbi:HAD-IA family hydrolase [Pseudonocardia xishanensis]|uniref:HAD family hydrolase n=1 Tax=Pseudonocardia xishanensis TaxID=630995 RepID=A0ABP8RD21_9PSEU
MDLEDLRAVLFDMDGTLVDSDAAVERAWHTWAAEFRVDPAAVLAVAHGRPSEPTVREMRPDLDDAAVAAAAARQLELQYTDLVDVREIPGAHSLLRLLDVLGLPWAVVTSADRRLAAARLGAAGLPTPATLVTSEDISEGKPSPEGYLKAAAALGVEPAACLVVEDSDPGLAAGYGAGMRTAALKGLRGDLTLSGLPDLADLLSEWTPPFPAPAS